MANKKFKVGDFVWYRTYDRCYVSNKLRGNVYEICPDKSEIPRATITATAKDLCLIERIYRLPRSGNDLSISFQKLSYLDAHRLRTGQISSPSKQI